MLTESVLFYFISGVMVVFLFMMLNLMKTWIGKLEARIKSLEEKQN